MKEKENRKCSAFEKCGGCQLLSTPYFSQLEQKQKKITELLGKYGKISHIIGMKSPLNYRNKITATFDRQKDGTVVSGLYQEKTHHIVLKSRCYLENDLAASIISEITKMVKGFKWMVYNENSGYGLLRHVMVRVGAQTGQVMVILVTTNPILPSNKNFVKAIRAKFPQITTIVQNVNDKDTTMVLGNRDIVLYGKGYIEDVLCGKRFQLSPRSFYQVNPVQTELLYQKAIEYAALTGNETVLDTYCGIGTIGICLSDKAAKVIGVELNKEAVKDAIKNATINKCKNITFYQQDATKFMLDMVAQSAAQQTSQSASQSKMQKANMKEKIDVLLIDPPRSGSTEEFMSAAIAMNPKRIIYISCGPDTLARDLAYMTKNSTYKVEKITPVDMFPMTEHVETVVLLSKGVVDKDNFRKVKVDFSLEDMDLTELRGKATYAQVKEYILNEFGLKVSSLYIAQVKKKCGIETGENHNLPKSEDARQPQVTPEKEEAIMKAFRHFGVI